MGTFWLKRAMKKEATITMIYVCMYIYPMLRADSRFWLVNNRQIWSRISRFTSSAWDIKTKERHWWRHNGDSNRRPLSLPLRYDLVTLCLYNDLGQINVIAGILKLWKRFRMSQILFEHGINSLPLVCFQGYGNLSTLSIAIPLGLRPRVVLRCSVWINSRIRVSKQGVTNSIYTQMICGDIQMHCSVGTGCTISSHLTAIKFSYHMHSIPKLKIPGHILQLSLPNPLKLGVKFRSS